ncbi:MAG: ribose 5-phosphate isomerase B, partial [Phycisphaerales bacterium]|nr:ribose 5-phosphate isomerase B [Phycisphaerales bacterium]
MILNEPEKTSGPSGLSPAQQPMKIALGADHRGDAAMKTLAPQLRAAGHDVTILGDCGGQSCDYPDQAYLVSQAVKNGTAQRGILICGSGIGVSIAANKVKGIRAALVDDEIAAGLSRGHNDCNVLCLAADTTPPNMILTIVDIWLKTEFEGGRHARRVQKIMAIERGEDPTKIPVDS